jgi:hypothetical protein
VYIYHTLSSELRCTVPLMSLSKRKRLHQLALRCNRDIRTALRSTNVLLAMAEQAPIALGILTLLSSALELVFAGPSHSQFLSNEDSAALVDFSQRLRELLDTQLKVASEGQAFPSELSSEAYRIAKEYSALLNETWMTIKQPHIRNLQRLQEHVQKRFRVLLEDLSRLEISQHLHTTNERLEDSSADL